MTLPNFLIAGSQKAGSTWLVSKLRQHPDVFMPQREVHFFNIEENFRQGLNWYERHFEGARGSAAIGEKTPNYFWVTKDKFSSRFGNHLPFTPEKIHSVLPDVKIIVIVRNPVERLISAVNHYRKGGQLSPIRSIDDLLIGRGSYAARQYGVFDMGLYDEHLHAFLEYFSESQLLVLVFEEDVVKSPEQTLIRVCEFLAIDPEFSFHEIDRSINAFKNIQIGTALFNHINPWPTSQFMTRCNHKIRGPWMGPKLSKVRPTQQVVDQLYAMYAEPNDRFFRRLGRRISSWTQDSVRDAPAY